VPVVEGDGFGDGLAAVFRVDIAALPLVLGESAQEDDPAVVEGVEETEREVRRSGAGVGQLGPEFLVVGLDGGPILGEREADADAGIHVAVGDVMDELADSPAAVAVRGVELGGTEAFDGGAEVFRKRGEDCKVRCVIGEIGLGAAEFSDREAGIDDGGRGGGCRGRAHTPQGTPGRMAAQGGIVGRADRIRTQGGARGIRPRPA
jgi:hypothetical protein